MKTLVIGTAVLAAAFVVAQTPQYAVVEGQKVPAFKMTDTAGNSISDKSLKGKVVLLDFWATWCGPCKAASPTVQELHEKFGKKGFVAIGADTFERDNKMGAAKAYANEHKYSYTFTVNNDALASAWGIRGIPFFVIIDRNGIVRKVQVGFSKEKTGPELSALVEKLVNGG